MGAVTVRKLEDAVIERLRERAKAAGRSMEEEIRTILTRETARPSPEEFTAQLAALRKEGLGFPDGTAVRLIREARGEIGDP